MTVNSHEFQNGKGICYLRFLTKLSLPHGAVISCRATLAFTLPRDAHITSSLGFLPVSSSCLPLLHHTSRASCCRPLLRSLLQSRSLRVLSRKSHKQPEEKAISESPISLPVSHTLCLQHKLNASIHTELRRLLVTVSDKGKAAQSLHRHSSEIDSHPRSPHLQIRTARPDSTSVSLHFRTSSLLLSA